MMNFRKIAAASKGRLLLRYFTENTPEPIHPPGVDAARPPARRGWAPDGLLHRAGQPGDLAAGHANGLGGSGWDRSPAHATRRRHVATVRGAPGGYPGEAWSKHPRKLSGFDLVFVASQVRHPRGRVRRHAGRKRRHLERHRPGERRRYAVCRKGARLGPEGARRRGRRRSRGGRVDQLPAITPRDRRCTFRTGQGGETYLFDAPVAGDPHAHIHNFLLNLVVTDDGRIGALDTRALTDARVKEFGASSGGPGR